MNENLMNPCVDYCRLRFNKQYSSDCDDTCEFAKVVKENQEMENRLASIACQQHEAFKHLAALKDALDIIDQHLKEIQI